MNSDTLFESMDLNPIKLFQLPPDPYRLFEFGAGLDQMLMREAGDVSGKNIFQKLISVIRRAIMWVVGKISSLIKGIGHFFGKDAESKKGTEKTFDQIADQIFGNTADESKATKPILFGFGEDRDIRIRIVPNVLKGLFDKPGILGNAHRSSLAYSKQGILILSHVLKRPQIMDPLMDILEELNQTKNIQGYLKKVNDARFWFNLKSLVLPPAFSVTMEELSIFQSKVSRFSKLIEVWDDFNIEVTANNAAMHKDWVDAFNEIAQLATYLQYGLNMIGSGMRQMYELDGRFHNKVETPDVLAKFVKLAIESNIPSKYIAHNINLVVVNEKMSTKYDPQKVSYGQGRVGLIPPPESPVIYKVAINGYGIRSNKSEFQVSEAVQGTEVANFLTRTFRMYEDGVVIESERAVPETIPHEKVVELHNQINGGLERAGKPFKIVDFNPGGFGKIGDRYVMLDYGQVRRRSA